jgi:hypothetical protein
VPNPVILLFMTSEEIIIHNEKVKFRNLLNAFKYIETMNFNTEIGKQLHADMCVCITEVIKPIIKEKANKFIEQ